MMAASWRPGYAFCRVVVREALVTVGPGRSSGSQAACADQGTGPARGRAGHQERGL